MEFLLFLKITQRKEEGYFYLHVFGVNIPNSVLKTCIFCAAEAGERGWGSAEGTALSSGQGHPKILDSILISINKNIPEMHTKKITSHGVLNLHKGTEENSLPPRATGKVLIPLFLK